jgi:hypothetical protein
MSTTERKVIEKLSFVMKVFFVVLFCYEVECFNSFPMLSEPDINTKILERKKVLKKPNSFRQVSFLYIKKDAKNAT